MEHYRYLVVEHYPDGGTWRHYFTNKLDAEWAIEVMQGDHKGRKYVLTEIND